MRRNTPKRIALLLGQDLGYSRRVLSGILGYTESRRVRWTFHNAPPDIRVLSALERWRPDGIIVHLSDPALGERLLGLSVPILSVTETLADLPIPFIDVDSCAVGRMAADYFLGMGFRSFAYYGSRRVLFSQNRERGFRERLEPLGYKVASLHADFLPHSPYSQDWERTDRQTAAWLKKLPKPVGILTSNDIPGRVIGGICQSQGIRVPEQVAILGVDNDVSECRMSFPALSSIELPAEQIGSRAIHSMAQMLKGEDIAEIKQYLPPVDVIVRGSTDHYATVNPRLKKVLDFIAQNAVRGVTVEDVCRYCGLSRRSLERLFRDEIQSTVLEQLQRTRLSRAKRMLFETELSVTTVAERAGFGSLRRMDRVFRQYEQAVPSDFRANARAGVAVS